MASLVFTSKSFKYLIRCEHAALWPDVSGVYARVRLAHSGLWAHLGGGIAPLLHRGAPPPPARIPKRGVLQTLGITPPPPPYLYHWDFFIFFLLRRGGGTLGLGALGVSRFPGMAWPRGGARLLPGPGSDPSGQRGWNKTANPTQPLFKQTTRGSQGCAECEPDSSGLLRL